MGQVIRERARRRKQRIRRTRLAADEFIPDRYPGRDVPQIRIPLLDFHILMQRAKECAALYLSAVSKRHYSTRGPVRQGTFSTSFSAWAVELGMDKQTFEAQASQLRQVGLLRWAMPLGMGKRTFWLGFWPVPPQVLAELEAHEEPPRHGKGG